MGVPPKPLELVVEVAQLSDPGRDPNKQINEDSCGHAPTKFGHLVVLCDGMGGHYGGQEASRRAITTVFEQIELAPADLRPGEALKRSVEVAARRVYELGGPPDNKVRPGSTIVSMLLHDGGVDVAHVGDSRAFVIRSGQIYPLTRDHSMVQAMIDAGYLTEDQAMGHPDSNKITRALGMKPDVDVDLRPEPMELFAGDLLLMASDGLTDLAMRADILGATRQALASGGLDHACTQLVKMANDRGGHDNITVQIARVVSTGVKRTNPGGAPSASQGGAGQQTIPQQQGPSITIPMQPSPTAHDGTSHAHAHAQVSGHAAHGHSPQPGYAVSAQHAPPPHGQQAPYAQHASGVGPTLGPGDPGFSGYRLDGVAGLGLPPPAAQAPYPSQQAYPQHAPYPQGQLAYGVPGPTPSQAGGPGTPGAGYDRPSGGVVYLILAASFFVACFALLLVWALFLR